MYVRLFVQMQHDQLSAAMANGSVFSGFREAPISLSPATGARPTPPLHAALELPLHRHPQPQVHPPPRRASAHTEAAAPAHRLQTSQGLGERLPRRHGLQSRCRRYAGVHPADRRWLTADSFLHRPCALRIAAGQADSLSATDARAEELLVAAPPRPAVTAVKYRRHLLRVRPRRANAGD